jgi:hypothetical protein
MRLVQGAFRRRLLSLAAGLLLLLAPAAAHAEGTTFQLFPYWEDGKPQVWYNFGARSPLHDGQVQTAPVWVITNDLNPSPSHEAEPVKGQDLIFDVKPGEPGYTDLWQVILVRAPQGYKPNSLTSRAEIEKAGLRQIPTQRIVDCPMVAPDDHLAGSNRPPYQGWVRGERVHYFELGEASPRIGKMWRFARGVDAQAQPALVPGQQTVSDGSGLAFHEVFLVEVPAGYTPNSITTVAQVQSSGYPIRPLNTVVNVPIPPAGEAAEDHQAGRYAVVGAFLLAWLLSAAYLLRLPRPQPFLSAGGPARLVDMVSTE